MDGTEEFTTQCSTVEEWTRALAESTGSPGGGAGTGVMLAIAASLASMVACYTETVRSKQEELAQVRARAQSLRRDDLRLADRDASASKTFGAAFRLEPGPQRDSAISRASLDAARASAVLGSRSVDAIGRLLPTLSSHSVPCGPRWPVHAPTSASISLHSPPVAAPWRRFRNGIRTYGRWLVSSTAQSIGSTA